MRIYSKLLISQGEFSDPRIFEIFGVKRVEMKMKIVSKLSQLFDTRYFEISTFKISRSDCNFCFRRRLGLLDGYLEVRTRKAKKKKRIKRKKINTHLLRRNKKKRKKMKICVLQLKVAIKLLIESKMKRYIIMMNLICG